jgi:hypothetical protein
MRPTERFNLWRHHYPDSTLHPTTALAPPRGSGSSLPSEGRPRAQGYPTSYQSERRRTRTRSPALRPLSASTARACRPAGATTPLAARSTRPQRLPRRRLARDRGAEGHAVWAALRLIGGRGTLARKNPVMTVESYWPYATTLFDYVRGAMPFNASRSLSADEVYAVVAYVLETRRRSSTKALSSTPSPCRKCRCPIATASSRIRALTCLNKHRRRTDEKKNNDKCCGARAAFSNSGSWMPSRAGRIDDPRGEQLICGVFLVPRPQSGACRMAGPSARPRGR